MKQNALLSRMLAHVHRTALDLQALQALQEDLVQKVPEVKEESMGQLGLQVPVEIQALQALRVLQAPRDPMDSPFQENRVARE